MMRLKRKALKIFLICSLIVISSGRSTQYDREKYNEEDQGFNENDSNLYFNGGEDEAAAAKLQIIENDLPKNGELFEGDMVMDDGLRRAVLGEESKKAAVYESEDFRSRHWDNGVVPYKIDDSLISVIRDKIPIAIKVFRHFTCVNYVPWQPGDIAYVMFKDGKGCSSSVGKSGSEQAIHLGKGCKRLGTIMHEMMHVMGIIHEQSRPDRDQYLKIKFKNIKDGLLTNFQKYTFNQADTLDTPYNYFSVMHYSNHAFSKNDDNTLESTYDKDLEFGQRKMISHLDAVEINKLYPCPTKNLETMDRCMDMPCEGHSKCCLFRDKTAAIIQNDIRRRKKDAQRRRERNEEWNEEWKGLLNSFLRRDDSA